MSRKMRKSTTREWEYTVEEEENKMMLKIMQSYKTTINIQKVWRDKIQNKIIVMHDVVNHHQSQWKYPQQWKVIVVLNQFDDYIDVTWEESLTIPELNEDIKLVDVEIFTLLLVVNFESIEVKS